MPITVHCPECQAHFHVGDEFAGRPGRCPECGTVLMVPGADPAAAHSHTDPDPYRTPRPVEAYEDPPLASRRRPRDYPPDHDQEPRDDFDDRPGPARFDPQGRATAWQRVSKGLWYVQVSVILYAFSQLFQTGFMLSRGMKEADPANLDSGMVAVMCGSVVVMLAASVFWLLGRFALVKVPYVPARGWAKASFAMGLGTLFLFCAAFCLLVMAVGAAAQGQNPGAVGIMMIAVLAFCLVFVLALGGEASALVTLLKIGTGLKDAGVAGWAKLCLGLLVALIAFGTVGACVLGVYVTDKQQKEQAAQAANNPNPGPAAGKGKGKQKGMDTDKEAPAQPPGVPPPANPPPPPNPFEAEPLDENTQLLVNAVILGMIFLYLAVFSVTLQKARGAIRREVKVLTGEPDKDPWDADHRY